MIFLCLPSILVFYALLYTRYVSTYYIYWSFMPYVITGRLVIKAINSL